MACTSNGDRHIISIKTGNAHKKCCHKLSLMLLKRVRGKILNQSQKGWWRPNGDCFQNYRSKLLAGMPIVQFDDAPFVITVYLWYHVLCLLYLPGFQHMDKSGYALPKVVNDIQVCTYQAKLIQFCKL